MKNKLFSLLLFQFLLLLSVVVILTPVSIAAEVELAQAQQAGQPGSSFGVEPLRVAVKKSLVVNSEQPLSRVAVSEPSIASAVIVSPTQVLVHGLTPGAVTLVLWNEQGGSQSFDLQVELDLPGLRVALQKALPGDQIDVSQLGASVVLSGRVKKPANADKALALAQAQTQSVVNLLESAGPVRDRAVLLQVRFAEVDRNAVQELGLNILSTGAGNTFGAISTQQFGAPTASAGAIPADAQLGRQPSGANAVSGGIGNQLKGMPAVFGLSDLLNIFLFRSDANLGATIRALQQRNLLEILAEPNVLALDGREATFLAGGEFPFPVVQGGSSFTAVTIQFREFGVRLKFTPNIQEDGTILLKVAPEVSSLDFSNALTISGFLVPAISTRRADTEVALREGQTFAIAGLLDNRFVEIASKIPLLGDIPFFGKLFRSRSRNRSNTELLVLVSPKLVSPLNPGEAPALPAFPYPLDQGKLDGMFGEARARSEQAQVK